MTFSRVLDDHEGFLMGDPEFEVHALARRSDTETRLSDWQCAGEHAVNSPYQPGYRAPLYAYDQNGAFWNGQVLLATKDQANAAQVFDSSFIYIMWEDDNTACLIVKDGQHVSDQIAGIAALTIEATNAVIAFFHFQDYGLAARTLVRLVKDIIEAAQNDDLVGIMVDQTKVGWSYSDATHAILQDVTGQLQGTGRAKLVVQP